MNYDNQIVVVKVDSSKDNMKSSRHIKRRLNFVRKMRNSGADPFAKGLSHNSQHTFLSF
jgi:hypothetical protein